MRPGSYGYLVQGSMFVAVCVFLGYIVFELDQAQSDNTVAAAPAVTTAPVAPDADVPPAADTHSASTDEETAQTEGLEINDVEPAPGDNTATPEPFVTPERTSAAQADHRRVEEATVAGPDAPGFPQCMASKYRPLGGPIKLIKVVRRLSAIEVVFASDETTAFARFHMWRTASSDVGGLSFKIGDAQLQLVCTLDPSEAPKLAIKADGSTHTWPVEVVW